MKAIANNPTQAHEAILHPIFPAKQKINHTLILKDHGGWEFIPFDDIVRCEADGNYSKIFKRNGQVIIASQTLKQIETHLTTSMFVRTHQSHIISIADIRRIDTELGVVLSNEIQVPISRRRKKMLLSVLGL